MKPEGDWQKSDRLEAEIKKLNRDLARMREEAEQVVVNHESHSAGVCEAGGVVELASALSQTADSQAWMEGQIAGVWREAGRIAKLLPFKEGDHLSAEFEAMAEATMLRSTKGKEKQR